jgi:hypothetical protein
MKRFNALMCRLFGHKFDIAVLDYRETGELYVKHEECTRCKATRASMYSSFMNLLEHNARESLRHPGTFR